jgi:hypothetical protein
MPLLPRKNNLDYQPDNIIQASKQLTTIALENMKNPLTDPDQPALSALSSQKSLSGSMDEFSKLLLQLQTSFIRAKQEGARLVLQREKRLDREELYQTQEQMAMMREYLERLGEEVGRMRGEGRPKGSKNKPKPKPQSQPQRPSTLLQIEDAPPQQPNIRTFFTSSQPVRRVSAEPVGRYGVLPVADYSNRMISQGAVADAEIADPDSENTESSQPSYSRDDDDSSASSARSSIPSWYNPNDDSSSSSSSSRSSNRYRYGGDGGDGWDDGDGDDTNSSHYGTLYPESEFFEDKNYIQEDPQKLLTSILLDITKQIRYLDLLLVSKIKPAVQQLNPQQLSTLSQAYATLTDIWNTFQSLTIGRTTLKIVDYMEDSIQFGKQIIKILTEELNKLKIDLLIVVNSYKQNEAIQPPNFTPNTFWDNSAVREMVGGGRTFTGRNHSGRDIPTIWRGAQRECAYKYML